MKIVRPPRCFDWIFPRYTWRFFVSEPVVFLTFDDGPHPDITPFVLDELAKYQFKATFFCVGANARLYPDLIARILNEGHSLGNHTMRHENGNFTKTNDYLNSTEECRKHIPSKLFRPPYGRMKSAQRKRIAKNYSIIMWSWLSYDFDATYPISKILKNADGIRKGDIIVLHDNPKFMERQKELLPKLLQLLNSKGLTSKSISL